MAKEGDAKDGQRASSTGERLSPRVGPEENVVHRVAVADRACADAAGEEQHRAHGEDRRDAQAMHRPQQAHGRDERSGADHHAGAQAVRAAVGAERAGEERSEQVRQEDEVRDARRPRQQKDEKDGEEAARRSKGVERELLEALGARAASRHDEQVDGEI
eukprot:7391552-Prymnesium_polylepis.2